MIDRHSLMTSFLQYTYKYKNENPNHFNITTIYNFLSTYGLYKEEVKFPYDENYFTYFKEYYRNNPNIRVDEVNNINNIDDFNFIKIYLNPSKDSYFNLATKLLTFLSANPDIKHYSDFSKECRSDQVILRVRKIEDAKKIINFINNDLTIVNNLRYPNPFLHWDKMVGFAFDKELSFNSAISYVIIQMILFILLKIFIII